MMLPLLLFCLFLFQNSLADLVIEINDGKVEGTSFTSASGQTLYAWRGIPYAQPPTGSLRFMPPVKVSPWNDTLDAKSDKPSCYFLPGTTYIEPPAGHSEDCLFINVYSPININEVGTSNRSVVFWIYGGAYTMGTSDFSYYDPTPYLEQDLIVVSFNYRLAALGFLSTQDDVILGNAGIKDQNLALQWARDNVAFFGGNPDDITLVGESAGAISVGYHLVAPKSRGIYKRAIMQSGNTILDFFQTHDEAITAAYSLAKQIDPTITGSNTTTQLKELLQAASVEDVLEAHYNIGLNIRTVLEPLSEDSILTEPVLEMVERGDFARVPILIGHNSEESLFFFNTIDQVEALAAKADAKPSILLPNMPLKEGANSTAIGEIIKAFYVGRGSFVDNLAQIVNWYSDTVFVKPTYKQALLQSAYVPVYFYLFSFYGTPSQGEFLVPGAGKVRHAADLAYLFNFRNVTLKTEADFLTRQRMVTLWSNFIKTSNPTPPDSPSEVLGDLQWEVTTANDFKVLEIGDDLELKGSEKVTELPFWDYIWDTYSYRPYNHY